MKKQFILLFLVFTTLTLSFAQAENLKVADETITSAIKNQLPVDRIESYRADFGKLYCFTRIVGAEGDTEVTHVWYYKDAELARVTLPVRSSDWRTYSSKRFLPQWSGQWRVVILDGEGDEIATVPFLLE